MMATAIASQDGEPRRASTSLADLSEPEREALKEEVGTLGMSGMQLLEERQREIRGLPFVQAYSKVAESIAKAQALLAWFVGAKELKLMPDGQELVSQAIASNMVTLSLLQKVRLSLISLPNLEGLNLRDLELLKNRLTPLSGERQAKEARARKELDDAMRHYLDVLNEDDEPHESFAPRTRQEEAKLLVSSISESLADPHADGWETEYLALAVARMLFRWLEDFEILRAFGAKPPPIAASLSRLNADENLKTHDDVHRVSCSVARLMDQAPLGPRSEEAVRRALIAWCEACGVPAKDAGNWFRP